MITLPFYIANFMAGFVKSQDKRHILRGRVNTFFYTPTMARFIRRVYSEKTQTVKFVRQHTPSRCVCVINDKYFIKIFKKNYGTRIKDFEFLVNYVQKKMKISIPTVFAAKNGHMYVTEIIQGHCIYDFEPEFVLKHEQKILNQVADVIHGLQSIDVKKIPNNERFCVALESPSHNAKIESITNNSILVHNDMNVRNFMFDNDLNICGLIDFDGLCIMNDADRDMKNFMKYWNRYKDNNKKQIPPK
jgi:hypothetical protein